MAIAATPWTEDLWTTILAAAALPLPFEPRWYGLPAIGRLTITRPELLSPFEEHNRRHPRRAVRPQSFVSVSYPKLFARADDVRLFAPYVEDARNALHIEWYELRSGAQVRITTNDPLGVVPRDLISVKSYGDVAREYAGHPESKFLAPNGTPCLRTTIGTLKRRFVRHNRPEYIGKEGNLIGRRIEGSGSLVEAQQSFEDPQDFSRYAVPRLIKMPSRELARAAGISERALRDILHGRSRPRASTQVILDRLARSEPDLESG